MPYFRWIFALMILCAQGLYAQTYDLPLLVIDTHGATISDEPKVNADFYVVDQGSGNQISDTAGSFHMPIGIELRGQTSASFDQKGYGLELRDQDGKGADTAFLGFPAGEDWVLHGPYVDKSLIRNALAYELYRVTGRYSARSRFVELILNGGYQGVYLILEKIKRGKYRVDIAKMAEKDTLGDDLTGGYIVRIDKSNDIQSEGFSSSQQLQYVFHYPQKEDLLSQQETYIKNEINSFETLMNSASWNDPVNGYSTQLDVDAAVDYILHEEITKNSDAYFCSFYMYKDKDSKGGKLNLGPPWDFNLAFGQVDYNNNMKTDGWQAEQNMNAGIYKIPGWLKKLFGDPTFRSKFTLRWGELRSSVWHSSRVNAICDSLKTLLVAGAQRHFVRWDILGKKTCPNLGGFGGSFCFNGYSEPTWDLEVSHMKNWFLGRIAWIDGQLNFQEPAEPVSIERMRPDIHGATYQLHRSTMALRSARAGEVVIRNLKGVALWRSAIVKGVSIIELPDHLSGTLWVASLGGKVLMHKNGTIAFVSK